MREPQGQLVNETRGSLTNFIVADLRGGIRTRGMPNRQGAALSTELPGDRQLVFTSSSDKPGEYVFA